MGEIVVINKNGSVRSVNVSLTGKETAEDLLFMLGLKPEEYVVQAGNSVIDCRDAVPFGQGPVIVVPNNQQSLPIQNGLEGDFDGNITVTLKIHTRGTGASAITQTFPASATPYDIAESLVRSVGGSNPEDIKVISHNGKNLMEPGYRYKSLASLGVRNGDVLSIHGDIIQG